MSMSVAAAGKVFPSWKRPRSVLAAVLKMRRRVRHGFNAASNYNKQLAPNIRYLQMSTYVYTLQNAIGRSATHLEVHLVAVLVVGLVPHLQKLVPYPEINARYTVVRQQHTI